MSYGTIEKPWTLKIVDGVAVETTPDGWSQRHGAGFEPEEWEKWRRTATIGRIGPDLWTILHWTVRCSEADMVALYPQSRPLVGAAQVACPECWGTGHFHGWGAPCSTCRAT